MLLQSSQDDRARDGQPEEHDQGAERFGEPVVPGARDQEGAGQHLDPDVHDDREPGRPPTQQVEEALQGRYGTSTSTLSLGTLPGTRPTRVAAFGATTQLAEHPLFLSLKMKI